MKNITITIDGHSSTGKSTIAKQLAKHLSYVYVDTGAMYRAVTYYAVKENLINNNNFNVNTLINNLSKLKINFKYNKKLKFAEVYLNQVNIEKHIRTLEISNYVSQVAAVPEVRYQLVKQQQEMGKNGGVVMDGRDIGTVVFPYAELKLFITANAETRAKRRYKELINKGHEVSYNSVLKNVTQRDYIDSTRKDSPLKKAQDAIEIDNSNMSLDEQFKRVLNLVSMTLEGLE